MGGNVPFLSAALGPLCTCMYIRCTSLHGGDKSLSQQVFPFFVSFRLVSFTVCVLQVFLSLELLGFSIGIMVFLHSSFFR